MLLRRVKTAQDNFTHNLQYYLFILAKKTCCYCVNFTFILCRNIALLPRIVENSQFSKQNMFTYELYFKFKRKNVQ